MDTRRARRRVLLLAGGLGLASAAALAIDLPVAASFAAPALSSWALPGDLRRIVTLCEIFGHGFGATVFLLAVFLLDPGGRRWLPRMIAIVAGAGGVATLAKWTLGRTRPDLFFRPLTYFQAGDAPFAPSVFDTFRGWLPLASLGSPGQSFPSGHSAVATALAIALAWRYPRGAPLYAVLALLVFVQRVVVSAHYPSDTLAGASLAAATAWLLFHPRLGGRAFDALEARAARLGEASR